jgi:hypothetical protein
MRQTFTISKKNFVPILYRDRDFEAFDDFSDFLESISCEPSESCQVRGSNPCRGATDFEINHFWGQFDAVLAFSVPVPGFDDKDAGLPVVPDRA